MSELLSALNRNALAFNDLLWSEFALYVLFGAGMMFTVWARFPQWTSLTHGVATTLGRYSDKKDPGALNHFQALSTALSGTVGLGNIGGVAIAIALGGPGAVFWMWVTGAIGMALKMSEVTLSMLHRNTDDPVNPHGGPMFVAKKAFAQIGLPTLGVWWGGVFCVCLLIAGLGGGSMFQAWNVGDVTHEYFGLPTWVTGVTLALLCGAVTIGGIKRIGAVTGFLVPFMCGLYILGGLYVIALHWAEVPALFALIFTSAFDAHQASGAFIGGTAGTAFAWGMKRALYSNEAGQGSSPMAHSAAKTDEPSREGIVAGLEPFIDTLIVCTISALVILSSGVWKHEAEGRYALPPATLMTERVGVWTLEELPAPARLDGAPWRDGENVFMVVTADPNRRTGNHLHRIDGTVHQDGGGSHIEWGDYHGSTAPKAVDGGVYVSYPGATLTAKAFDSAQPGLGKWLVTIAVWFFALSTMISWSYYGEQGVVYLGGRSPSVVKGYRLLFCALALVANLGFLTTNTELDTLTTTGTGVMLWANIPLLFLFGRQAMASHHDYMRRLKAGEMQPSAKRSLGDLLEGKDVE
jgi:AGCS family alanine or glycine:cation symporter